jgi:molybdopterin-guanine dinucleotide biosynthesis protein A
MVAPSPPLDLATPDLVTPDLVAVVLAGGRARRMAGSDKPLMRLGGRPLVTYAIAALSHAPSSSIARPLAISANGDITRFEFLRLPVLQDSDDSFPGPLAGVLAGLEWAQKLGAKALLSVPADCPFLPLDLTERLAEARPPGSAQARAGGQNQEGQARAGGQNQEGQARAGGQKHIAYARAGGRDHPTTALWPVSAQAALAAYLARGERRVMGFLKAFGTLAVDWPDETAFININTPEDLAQAEALLAQRGKT